MNNKFVEWIAQASGKVGTNKFILAIRDAFADTIPIPRFRIKLATIASNLRR